MKPEYWIASGIAIIVAVSILCGQLGYFMGMNFAKMDIKHMISLAQDKALEDYKYELTMKYPSESYKYR